MARKYKYITAAERCVLERMDARGAPVADMAAALGVSPSTLYRELQKGRAPQANPAEPRRAYSAKMAQQVVEANIKRRGRTATGGAHGFKRGNNGK